MTSRERILAAIAHQTPDRVPVDMGSTPSSTISAIAYSNLLKHLGKDLPVQIYDVVQQLAQPDDGILDMFGVDVIDVGRAFNEHPSDWYPVTMANGAKAFYPVWFKPELQPSGAWYAYDNDDRGRLLSMMPAGGTFFDQTYFPYVDGYPDSYRDLDVEMSRIMWARHVSSPWDHAGEADFYRQLREKTLRLRQTTDKALLICCGCNLFEWGTFLRRMDNFLMDLLCEPDNVAHLLEELMKRHIASLEKVCAAVGDIVDVIRIGDDLGMTSGPFMSADIYRKYFKKHHKTLCDFIKSHSSAHVFIHSCGSIAELMPDLIDAGIEIFNPVQTNARGMKPDFLKKEFGADCTFWGGGIENVGTLNTGSPQQIRDQVFERLEVFSAGGGFVFNTVHNILPDVPPENIVAMFDAIREFNERGK